MPHTVNAEGFTNWNDNTPTGGGFDPRAFTSQTFLPPEKQQAFATLNQFLQDPLQNITNRLGPLLRSLVPSEQSARQGLLDQFRRAGGLRSGAFAQGARQLEGDIFGRRAETATRASLGALGPILGGYQTALTGIPALSRSQELLPTNAGGGRGAGSNFGGFGFGFNQPLAEGNLNYPPWLQGQAGGASPGLQYGTGEMIGSGPFYDPTNFGGGAATEPYPWLDYGESPLYSDGGSAFTPGIYD